MTTSRNVKLLSKRRRSHDDDYLKNSALQEQVDVSHKAQYHMGCLIAPRIREHHAWRYSSIVITVGGSRDVQPVALEPSAACTACPTMELPTSTSYEVNSYLGR